VRSIVYTAEHGLIASAGDDQLVNVWDARTGRLLRRLAAHGSRVCAVALSPDGRVLASGDANGDVKLWDVESGTELASLYGHTNMVFSLDFDPTGDLLASGAADASVRLWNLRHFDRHMAGNIEYQRSKRSTPVPGLPHSH
jgi:WD40 repeat protein